MNKTKMSVLSLLLTLHLSISVGAQSSSFTLSGSVSSLTVGGDKVLASTGNTVYQILSDLQQKLSNQVLRLVADDKTCLIRFNPKSMYSFNYSLVCWNHFFDINDGSALFAEPAEHFTVIFNTFVFMQIFMHMVTE